MEHAPTISALCGGRLAKAKGVRYGPPTKAQDPQIHSFSERVGAGVGGSESTVNVTQLRVRVLMYLSRARTTELSRLDGIPTPRPLPSV